MCQSQLLIIGFGQIAKQTGFIEILCTEDNVDLGNYNIQTKITAVLPRETVEKGQLILLSTDAPLAYEFLEVTSLKTHHYFGYPNASYVDVKVEECKSHVLERTLSYFST